MVQDASGSILDQAEHEVNAPSEDGPVPPPISTLTFQISCMHDVFFTPELFWVWCHSQSCMLHTLPFVQDERPIRKGGLSNMLANHESVSDPPQLFDGPWEKIGWSSSSAGP